MYMFLKGIRQKYMWIDKGTYPIYFKKADI